jgi:cell division cycle 20-like protein 1 (cofactor of APC complex)
MFSKSSNEIVSTHGYSDNAVVVWKYPSLKKVATLTGHNLRVLYLAMSPDAETVVTGAGDETLRFWKLFPKLNKGVNNGYNGQDSITLDPLKCCLR